MNYPGERCPVRTEESMAKSFDRVADRFDATRSLPEDTMEAVVKALQRAMAPGAKVLDAGVGTGRFALPLQERGYDVAGIDISTRMMEKAAAKGVANLVRSDVCALPFKDLAFDYALSVHLIHLIPHWRSALKEIGRVTRKDLISVVADREHSDAEDLRNAYRACCKRLGFDVRHAGPGERELPELLPPDSVVKLAVREEPFDVQKMLVNYEERTLSEQWDVPEDIHRAAVKELRGKYGTVDALIIRENIYLIVWSADRLRAVGRAPR